MSMIMDAKTIVDRIGNSFPFLSPSSSSLSEIETEQKKNNSNSNSNNNNNNNNNHHHHHHDNRIAKFHRQEIHANESVHFGGEFSQIHLVDSIHLLSLYVQPEAQLNEKEELNRQYIYKKYNINNNNNNNSSVLSLKEIPKPSSHSPSSSSTTTVTRRRRRSIQQQQQQQQRYQVAIATLVIEAQLLSRLNHPNIIKLRGIPIQNEHHNNHSPNSSLNDFFIITDTIVETLAERIDLWRERQEQEQLLLASSLDLSNTSSSSHTGRYQQQKQQEDLLQEKLHIVYQIISALDYLHERKICVMNLNPHNIGFRRRRQQQQQQQGNKRNARKEVVQLFDLGHCREIQILKNKKKNSGVVKRNRNNNKKKKKQEHTEHTTRASENGDEEVAVVVDDDDDDDAVLSSDELSVDDLSVMLGSPVIATASPISTTNGNDNNHTNTDGSSTTADTIAKTCTFRKIIPTAAMGVVPRYLAPEIVCLGHYCLRSDSYSMALILFEMLSLSLPYATYQPGQHYIKVCVQGKRPNIALYQFPTPLDNMIQQGWKHNWNKRLSIHTMKKVLMNVQFSKHGHGDGDGERKSTVEDNLKSKKHRRKSSSKETNKDDKTESSVWRTKDKEEQEEERQQQDEEQQGGQVMQSPLSKEEKRRRRQRRTSGLSEQLERSSSSQPVKSLQQQQHQNWQQQRQQPHRRRASSLPPKPIAIASNMLDNSGNSSSGGAGSSRRRFLSHKPGLLAMLSPLSRKRQTAKMTSKIRQKHQQLLIENLDHDTEQANIAPQPIVASSNIMDGSNDTNNTYDSYNNNEHQQIHNTNNFNRSSTSRRRMSEPSLLAMVSPSLRKKQTVEMTTRVRHEHQRMSSHRLPLV